MENSHLTRPRKKGMSVVIPCHNAEEFVEKAIHSSFLSGANEVIVVDDGSTDLTAVKARSLGANVIVQENAGPAISRMTGLKSSNFEIVTFLDADDELIPEGVKEMCSKLDSDSSLVGVVGATLVRKQGKIRGKLDVKSRDLSFESLLRRGLPPGPPACAVWKTDAVIGATKGISPGPKTNHAEDYSLFLAMSSFGAIGKVASNVCVYSAGLGRSSKNIERGLADVEKIRQFFGELSGIEVKSKSLKELSQLRHFRLFYEAPWSMPLFKLKNLMISFTKGPSKYIKAFVGRLRGD